MDDLAERLSTAYLSVHYHDPHRDLHTWRIYQRDGAVQLYDGQEWRVDYALTTDQIEHIQQAVADCGLPASLPLRAAGIHDTAVYTVAWELPDGISGEVANYAYPALTHVAIDCLMDVLLEIEEAYTGAL